MKKENLVTLWGVLGIILVILGIILGKIFIIAAGSFLGVGAMFIKLVNNESSKLNSRGKR